MNARLLTAMCALLLALRPAAIQAAGFEYGSRPPEPVFDPSGFLEPRVLREIAEPLARIHREENIDVIVVILKDLEGAPPEHVAGRFAAEWCDSPLHAVVLHVPGHAESPWITPAGKLSGVIRPEKIRDAVARARRNASREPGESAKVRAAATEAADMLRYWMGTAINRSESIENARAKIRAELETKARQRKIVMLGLAASAIPLLVGGTLLFYLPRQRGPRRFLEATVPRRLGAPHAGGNHAVVDLGPPRFPENP
jgi:hypothetical protein